VPNTFRRLLATRQTRLSLLVRPHAPVERAVCLHSLGPARIDLVQLMLRDFGLGNADNVLRSEWLELDVLAAP
jgi:hypothetical protein